MHKLEQCLMNKTMSNAGGITVVLSDIHANLEALTAVLQDIEKKVRGCRIVCLGDIIGYGPDPGACLNLMREKAWHILAGNHDLAATSRDIRSRMNAEARYSVRWAAAILETEEKTFLAGLPLEIKTGPFHFVHGSPHQPDQFNYILDISQAKKAFFSTSQEIIFTGHSHIPAIFIELEFKRMFGGHIHKVERSVHDDVEFDPSKRYVINVGSVGQPRDGDFRAAYGLIDPAKSRFQLVRVDYDVDATAEKIRQAGLPEALARRLKHGK